MRSMSIRRFIQQESYAWDISRHEARRIALAMRKRGLVIKPHALLIIPTPGVVESDVSMITHDLVAEMNFKGMSSKNWCWKQYQHLYHLVGYVHVNKYAPRLERIAIQIGR